MSIPLTVPGLAGSRTVAGAATEYRPDGDGPFAAIVLSHGSTLSAQDRATYTAKYRVASAIFVGWNGVRILRQPFLRRGGSGDGVGHCGCGRLAGGATVRRPDAHRTGRAVGRRLGLAGRRQPRRRADRRRDQLRRRTGGKQRNIAHNTCAPDRLVAPWARLGKTATVPSLWIYAENDQFFSPALSRRMHEAYTSAGAPALYHLTAAIGADGHHLLSLRGGVPLWKDTVEEFLRSINARK